MFRWLLIGVLIYGIGTGLKDGWLVVKWSQFFHDAGFTSVDPNEPMDWNKFIMDRFKSDPSR